MLINHLGDGIAQKHDILIKRFDLTLQFDPVNKVNLDGHVLSAQGVEKRVLQQLTFIIAHDIFRVQKLISFEVNTR